MSMIAKLNELNHLELPVEAIEAVGRSTSFDIQIDGGRLVLTPTPKLEEIMAKLDALDLQESDVTDAIEWARRSR